MLRSALQAIADELGELLQVTERGVHRGPIDVRELARLATRTPALWMVCTGLGESDFDHADGVSYVYGCELAAILIERDALGSDRLERMLDQLIEPLLGYIPGQLWGGEPWQGPAPKPRADNLFSTDTDKQGLALWALAWDQPIRLPRLRAPA